MRRLRVAIAMLMASPAAAGDGLDLAIRALSEPSLSARLDEAGAVDLAAPDVAGWLVRRETAGLEQLFLVNALQVVRGKLPLPSGLGMAVTVYDVLDGRISPREALAGLVEGEAKDAVFTGVQAAMLWLAAKAVAGSTTVAAAGTGLAATAVSATAPAAGAMVAPLPAAKLGAALPGPWADVVLFGAAGVATVAAAAASAAVGWGWRNYQEAALRSSEAEGLLRGAERVAAAQ